MRSHLRLRAGTAAAGLVGGITLVHCTSNPCTSNTRILPSVQRDKPARQVRLKLFGKPALGRTSIPLEGGAGASNFTPIGGVQVG
jgi:hypothetical protein